MKKTLTSSRTKSALQQLCTVAVTQLIRGYQVIISPIIGPCCRFYPSCSAYALEAINRYGLLKGTNLCIRRLLKCHPFHPGGFDPVP